MLKNHRINKTSKATLLLISQAQQGDRKSERELIDKHAAFVNFMVNKYSKKTEIKDDDDLRSCVLIGLLESIRRFDPSKNVSFIYFSHIWVKKQIFLEEVEYRFIRIPTNQKVFYDRYIKDNIKNNENIDRQIEKDWQRFLTIEESSVNYFTDLAILDSVKESYVVPDELLLSRCNDTFDTRQEESNVNKEFRDRALKHNINKVLSRFNDKEVFIIERLFGLNGYTPLSYDEIAVRLNVTKVNIAFTKTRVIKTLRHASLSNEILKGI